MNHKYLSIIIVFAALSTVACSDDKGGGQAAGPQTCATNPTLPGCSLQKVALAQVNGSPEQAALMAALNKTPAAGANQVPGISGAPKILDDKGGIRVSSVGNSDLQAHAAKVAAALEADTH